MPEKKTAPGCEFMFVHQEIVDRVNQAMPAEETLFDLAELFKIFGDSTRIKILYVLFESEMCVCDIAQLLGMTQSRHFPPAPGLEKEQAGQIPPGGAKPCSTPWRTAMSAPFWARAWSTSPSKPNRPQGRPCQFILQGVFRHEKNLQAH